MVKEQYLRLLNNNKLISIGSLNKPHGLKGELKVFLYNEDSETLVRGISVWLKKKDQFKSFTIENIRGSKNKLILKFKKINSRKEAEPLTKKTLYVSREDLPKLEDGFYFTDIIGFSIKNAKDKSFGILEDVITVAGRELLVIVNNNREILLPNVDEYVELFDFENKTIIVNNFEQFIE